jgi:hypothetical protein
MPLGTQVAGKDAPVSTVLLFGLVLIGQASKDTSTSPVLASHIGMELDDLDFEIKRQDTALQVAKARLSTTQRAMQRGTSSRGELEQVTADVRSLEAREAEAIAFRALKAYQRDVLSGAVPNDDAKAHALVLELLKCQELMAQVELGYQTFKLKQDDALLARGAIGRPERDGTELDYETARLHVALSRARQSQVKLEQAVKAGAKDADPQAIQKLKTAYLQTRVQYYEIGATIAKNRLEIAKDQLRHGRLAASEADFYQKAYDAADEILASERKRLTDPSAPPPSSLPRAG